MAIARVRVGGEVEVGVEELVAAGDVEVRIAAGRGGISVWI